MTITLPTLATSDFWKLTKIAIDGLEEDKRYLINLVATGYAGTLLLVAGGDSTNGDNYIEDVPTGSSNIILTAENVDQSNAVSIFHFGDIDITSVAVALYSVNPLCEILQPPNLYNNNTAFDDGFTLGFE